MHVLVLCDMQLFMYTYTASCCIYIHVYICYIGSSGPFQHNIIHSLQLCFQSLPIFYWAQLLHMHSALLMQSKMPWTCLIAPINFGLDLLDSRPSI